MFVSPGTGGGGSVRLTYTSKDVQGPIFEKETARGCTSCRGAEHRSDPIAGYVTVMIFYP